MLKFNLKIKVVSIIVLTFLFVGTNCFSQDFPPRAKERMAAVKKMRLLEILDLKDADADKFLVRYTTVEKEIMEKNDLFRKANEDLMDYIEDNPKGKELNDKTNNVLQAQKELHKAIENKFSTLKYILSDENFAKLVAFESQFARKMRQRLLNRDEDGGMPAYEDGPPPKIFKMKPDKR